LECILIVFLSAVPAVFAAVYLSFCPQLIHGGLHHEDSSWFRYAAVSAVCS
jgi:hypothetical protein